MKFDTLAQEIAIIFLFLCMVTTASAQSWEFNTPQDAQGWVAYNAGTINEVTNVQNDGLFIIDPVGPDPRIEIHGISLDVSTANNLDFRMSSNCPDNIGAIYFETAESPGFSEDKKVDFTVITGPEWHEYSIPMSGNVFWNGIVTGLRIDPADYGNLSEDDNNDAFGFDYIRVISSAPANPTIPTNIFSPDSNLNVKVTNVDATKLQNYFAYKNKQTMNPIAAPIVDAGNEHAINSIFLMALAAWEGGWGTSPYSTTRHNWFGYGAYYSNPDNAWEFSSDAEGVNVVARRIKADYLLNSGKYSVLIPTGTINNHPAYPYNLQSVDVGTHYNGPTVRGWIVKWNINSQSEMDGIVSIMNDFASWHLQTYGEEIIIIIIDDVPVVPIPTPEQDVNPVNTQSVISGTYYIEDERIGLAIAWAESMIGSAKYPYYCLMFVEDAYKFGANSNPERPWNNAKKASIGLNAKNNDGLPPRGSFVFFEWTSRECPDCGHVGLSLGDGNIIHAFGTSPVKISDYTKIGLTYIGWAYPPLTPQLNRRFPLSGNLYGFETKKDITGVFDSSTSEFTFGSKTVQFGLNTDIPVIGDWDKDGKDEIGVFRPIDDDGVSRFYLITRDWNDLPDKAGYADKRIYFGSYPTNIPIAGDWDGDGDDDIGGFSPEKNIFYLYKLDLDKSSAKSYQDVPFGITGDIPFIGDWNGDRKDEIGVFRYPDSNHPNTNAFYFDRDLTGVQHDLGVIEPDGKLQPYAYGDVGDYPVIGDWDGDGDDNIGVYRPSTQKFYDDSTIPRITNTNANVNDENANLGVIINIIEKYGSKEEELKYDSNVDLNKDGIINIHDITKYFKGIIMNIFK